MTHQCHMTCCVVFFTLITIALSLVTCLTSTTMPRLLQKWRIELVATGSCSLFPKDKSMSVFPGSLPTTDSMPAAPSWTLGFPPSLRGNICFFCELHGCPTGRSTTGGVLNWLIFLAYQVMCWILVCFSPTYLGRRLSWLPSIPAVDRGSYWQHVPLQHP